MSPSDRQAADCASPPTLRCVVFCLPARHVRSARPAGAPSLAATAHTNLVEFGKLLRPQEVRHQRQLAAVVWGDGAAPAGAPPVLGGAADGGQVGGIHAHDVVKLWDVGEGGGQVPQVPIIATLQLYPAHPPTRPPLPPGAADMEALPSPAPPPPGLMGAAGGSGW